MDANWKVLARIPDLNTFGKDGPSKTDEQSSELPTLGSRILNQSLSVKLLSGLALVLVVASVLPIFSGGKKAATDTLSAVDSNPERQFGDVAPDEAKLAGVASPRPMTLVPAVPENASAPEKVPLESGLQPAPAADEPLVSSWPNPAQSSGPDGGAGGGTPRVSSRRPMAVRPNEYQADARSTPAPRSPEAGSRENTTETPGLR